MNFEAQRDRLDELTPEEWKVIRNAARAGDAEAQYLLGYRFNWCTLGQRGCEKWLQAAAAQNHPEATYQLAMTTFGRRLRWGTPLVADKRELLLRAAELGCLEAQRTLAVCYIWGEDGYEENWIRARFWYRVGAREGYPESLVACGSMMVRGDGGETRRTEGLHYLETAAVGTDRECAESAMRELIAIYEGWWGLVPEPDKAAEWKARLAEEFPQILAED